MREREEEGGERRKKEGRRWEEEGERGEREEDGRKEEGERGGREREEGGVGGENAFLTHGRTSRQHRPDEQVCGGAPLVVVT